MTLPRTAHPRHESDALLKAAVIAELGWIPDVDSVQIGVSVNDGAVTLSGEVASYPEKLLAAKAAHRVRGVTAVAQEISVRSTTWGVNDTDIAREAGEALRRAVDVPDSVRAAVHDRAVTLTGSVSWQYEREASDRAVRHLKGVTSVCNDIALRTTAATVGLQEQIAAAFTRNAQIDASHLTVSTDPGGVVTLEGTVSSWAEQRAATKTCWAAPGVTGVRDHLRLEY